MKEKLLSIMTNIWKRKDLVLVAGVAILFILLFRQCDKTASLKNASDLSALNIKALNDSMTVEKNKSGEVTYAKDMLLTSKKELESLNKDLAQELDKAKGTVIALQKVNSIIKSDTVYIENTVTAYPNNSYGLNWAYDTTYSVGNYRKFSGSSFFTIDTIRNSVTHGETKINQDEIGFSFVTGIREKDKDLEIFITPKYPDMKITDIEGAIIDPQKSDVLKKMFPNKRWSLGPYVGVGIGAGTGFDGKPVAGLIFNVGISLQWSWIKF